MSSEAITRNDLTAILNEVLPPTPSEYKKLLWTNPNPTSSFAAQTISLDLSSYDTIEVHFKTSTTSAYTQYVLADIGNSSKYLNRDNGANNFYVRAFSITTSSVQFDSGYYQGTANDIYGIPLNIYGIKYERVAPPQVDASDYVIEQGTSGYWSYRKWDSGIAECWTGRIPFSGVSSAGTVGGFNYAVITTAPAFPFEFAAFPSATVGQFRWGTGVCLANISEATTTQVSNMHIYSTSVGDKSGYYSLSAIGRWK